MAMLSAAEEYQGRQSNDIGTLRSQVDQLIQAQLGQQAQPAPEPEDEPSFFEDPETAVGRQIENHPLVQEARATSAQYKAEMAQQRLLRAHPDMNEILADPKFAAYVQASPMRVRMLQDANTKLDVEAASELFDNWKQVKGVAQQTVSAEKQQRDKAKAAASVSSAPASSAPAPVVKYRRSEIIDFMNIDPDRYLSMAVEFLAAGGSDAARAHALLNGVMHGLVDTLVASTDAQVWSGFVAREMHAPGEAFAVLYERLWQPGTELAAQLIHAARGGRGGIETARLEAAMLISNLVAFTSGRRVTKKIMGWQEIGPDQLAAVRRSIARQVDALVAVVPGDE